MTTSTHTVMFQVVHFKMKCSRDDTDIVECASMNKYCTCVVIAHAIAWHVQRTAVFQCMVIET